MSVSELYRIFYQKTPVMMQAIDNDGTLQAVSKKWLEKLGYEEDEVLGKKVFDFLSESTNAKLLSGLLQMVLDHGSFSDVTVECIKKDGSILTTLASAQLVNDESGNPSTITWSLYDTDEFDQVAAKNHDHFKQLIQIKNKLLDERDYLREELSCVKEKYPLISQSHIMQALFEQISAVAKTDANVLILGETGVGKELVARTIVKQSQRHDKPFVTVNCASISKELFESELFGHIKGSFTGATESRKGRWELADTGTIFLDEVGEIPLELQAKLLRAIQHKEFERIGDEKTRNVDIRILAATNRNLHKMVEEGDYREDLFYRLNVFPIEVPPLRERKEDIALLTRHFLDQSCQAFTKDCYGLNEQAIATLTEYDWPGNIRELQNLIERSVILTNGLSLSIDPSIFVPSSISEETLEMQSASNRKFLTAEEMRHLERESILAALDKANWKISGKNSAAEYLGINASTLASKINSLGIKKN